MTENNNLHKEEPDRKSILTSSEDSGITLEVMARKITPDSTLGPAGGLKHSETAAIMALHNLKASTNKFLAEIDQELGILDSKNENDLVKGISTIGVTMNRAWAQLKIGHELGYALCDHLRECGFLERLVSILVDSDKSTKMVFAAARALEECLSVPNRDFLVKNRHMERILQVTTNFWGTPETADETKRVSASLLENFFKHSPEASLKLIKFGALDHILSLVKTTNCSRIYKHSAAALVNLSIYGDAECYQKMIEKKVPDWLFFLIASVEDVVTRYYACFTICLLAAHKETEAAAVKSGTLNLVEPVLLANSPRSVAQKDFRLAQGRVKDWLSRIVPMLYADRSEPRSMAAFHFVMEASIKKEREKLEIFQEIDAIEALKTVASSPDGVAPKFARKALKIIGEELPYKLSQQVPNWTVNDVKYWVTKQSADYSSIDETKLDEFLMSINPHLSVYTYHMLEMGLDTTMLPTLTDDSLKDDCHIKNRFHRNQILQAIQDWKHVGDMEVAILAKHIDIFISYRRSSGCQLASLIKVLLQLRGHKVFIDVDRLTAGQFDTSLLKNIQAAKHFILILCSGSLDRCIKDDLCEDWVHKEICCALQHQKNVIPILDPSFDWPEESELPKDMRPVTHFNAVRWVHEYQEACIDKVERFLRMETSSNTLGRVGSRGASPTHGLSGGKSLQAINTQSWRSRSRPKLASKDSSDPFMPLSTSQPNGVFHLEDNAIPEHRIY